MRSAEPWPFSFEKAGFDQDRILHGRRIHIELSLEIVKERDEQRDAPLHTAV